MRKIIVLVLLITVTACAAPGFYLKPQDMAAIKYVDDVEPVKVERLSDFIVIEDDINKIPETLVSIEFHEGVSVNDFFFSLSRAYKINIMVDIAQKQKSLPAAEGKESQVVSEDMQIQVPRYQGTLRGLCQLLQKSYGLFFYMSGNSIIVRDMATCAIRILYQDDKDMVSLIQKSFGAKDVYVDKIKSAVVFNANAEMLKKITEYYRSYPVSVVDLDIAFLEYELSDEQSIGFDVAKLNLILKDGLDLKVSLQIKGDNGFTVSAGSGVVSLSALLQSFSTYSRFQILQRVTVSGLVGKTINLDVSEKIPYVSKVTSTSGQSGAAVRGYEFSEANNGLTFAVDVGAGQDVVMLKNDLRYQSVSSYIEVGTDQDRLSRPVVSARNIQSYITMRPGEVTKLASIRYEKTSRGNSGFYALNGMLRQVENRRCEVVVLGRAILKRYIFQ